MNDSLPKAILFDLDDTIIQHSNVEAAWLTVLSDVSSHFGSHDITDVHRIIAARSKWFWSDPERHRRGRIDNVWSYREILGAALLELGIDNGRLVDDIGESYRELRYQSTALFPGAVETVQHFRELGVSVGLITNGGREVQRRKIDKFDLEGHFDEIIIEGEFGVGKPNERVYLHMLEAFGTKPHETWMVGDNFEWEVIAPKKLGIAGIWVDHAKAGLPESSEVQPDRIVHLIRELWED